MSRSSRRCRLFAVLFCLASLALPAAAAAATAEAPPRVIAVGDVHGELEGLRRILMATGVMDAAGAWSGGGSILVQLGDLLDRGPEVRAVLDLMMGLQRQAPAHGGEVVALMGNHEQMNLLTVYDDVSRRALEAFAGEDSEELRRRAHEDWLRWVRSRLPEDGEPFEERETWLEEHPPGWLEYHRALAPDGRYGEWIRERPVAAVRGGVLFMHAGLSPEHADRPVAEINRLHAEAFQGFDRVRRYLVERRLAPPAATYDDLRRALLELAEEEEGASGIPPAVVASLARDFDGVRWTLEGEAPLWFRGYARWSEEELAPLVERILGSHGVERVVAAHSPLKSASIQPRLGDRVFLVDTGMLAEVYGGRPSALVIEESRITAIYPEERRVLVEVGKDEAAAVQGPPPRVLRDPEGSPLAMEEDEILAFLREAPVVGSRELGVGVTGARRLELERSGRRLRAIFHDIDEKDRGTVRVGNQVTMYFRDSYLSQVAAYELTRLLGLRRVPPTVQRKVGDEEGSAQLWVEDAVTWGAVQEEGLEIPDRTYAERQIQELRVFDNLIHNTDRNQGNILFDRDWNLWWIDHTRSFTLHRDLVAPELVRRCSRKLWESLQALDEETVRERLLGVLSTGQIRALLRRRELLIELLRERIGRLGEEKVLFDFDDPPPRGVTVTYERVDEGS